MATTANLTRNPMIFASDSCAMSAQCTGSIFFSTPMTVTKMIWDTSASTSLQLFDMHYNQVIHATGIGFIEIIGNDLVFADGLRTSTSTNIGDGFLNIWVK